MLLTNKRRLMNKRVLVFLIGEIMSIAMILALAVSPVFSYSHRPHAAALLLVFGLAAGVTGIVAYRKSRR